MCRGQGVRDKTRLPVCLLTLSAAVMLPVHQRLCFLRSGASLRPAVTPLLLPAALQGVVRRCMVTRWVATLAGRCRHLPDIRAAGNGWGNEQQAQVRHKMYAAVASAMQMLCDALQQCL
jgi:hypothetical protein